MNKPQSPQISNNNQTQITVDEAYKLAVNHYAAERYSESDQYCTAIIKTAPSHIDATNLLGIIAQKINRHSLAIEQFEKAININKNKPLLYYNLAISLYQIGRETEAAYALKIADNIEPNNKNISEFLYSILDKSNGNNTVNSDETNSDEKLQQGILLQQSKEFYAAIKCYKKVLTNQPNHPYALCNIGVAYLHQGKIKKAVKSFTEAIEIKPDYADPRYNLSLLQLVKCDFKNGWENYSWRWKTDKLNSIRYDKHKDKLWHGENVKGKRILVWTEQSIGESIIFSSMITDLIKLGADVVLECDKRLIPLFSRSIKSITCIANGKTSNINQQYQDFDYIVPDGDLGRWLRPGINSFPKRSAHLIADPKQKKSLQKKYQKKNKKLLVGISWNSKNSNHTEKSITLNTLLTLLNISGVTFVNLQYVDTKKERKELTKKSAVKIIHDNTIDQKRDLDSYAAQIAAMDLVITMSNTTAHLGGALGVPTLLMLDNSPLWYWMLHGKKSIWYSSVDMFRQKKPGKWIEVIAEVKKEIQEMIVKK
jgi:Flp pilus assembly protein TadD